MLLAWELLHCTYMGDFMCQQYSWVHKTRTSQLRKEVVEGMAIKDMSVYMDDPNFKM